MIRPSIQNELLEQFAVLSPEKQRQVLEYARRLSGTRPPGVPGNSLLKFAGAIPPDELALMEAAIEEGCEQIDPHGW